MGDKSGFRIAGYFVDREYRIVQIPCHGRNHTRNQKPKQHLKTWLRITILIPGYLTPGFTERFCEQEKNIHNKLTPYLLWFRVRNLMANIYLGLSKM